MSFQGIITLEDSPPKLLGSQFKISTLEGSMGTKSKVVAYANRAIRSRETGEKLDSIARAIAELADFVSDLENQLRRIQSKQR